MTFDVFSDLFLFWHSDFCRFTPQTVARSLTSGSGQLEQEVQKETIFHGGKQLDDGVVLDAVSFMMVVAICENNLLPEILQSDCVKSDLHQIVLNLIIKSNLIFMFIESEY